MKVKVVNIIDKNTFKATATAYKKHPKYGKYITVTKNYLVHTNDKAVTVGDEVNIVSTRPISRLKRWLLS